MSRIAFSALSFFFVIIVPLQGNDEVNVSLIQITRLVRLSSTGQTKYNDHCLGRIKMSMTLLFSNSRATLFVCVLGDKRR